jgi:integrase
MDNMPIQEEWLSQILAEGTRKGYTRAITYFKEFMDNSSTEDLIKLRKEERNFETKIIQFYKWLQDQRGISQNSARAYIIGIQSLFNYAGSPLRLKNKLPRLHMKLESWKPSLEELQKLYKFNDISLKAWLSLSRDIPARMSDMLRITIEQIKSGEFLLQSKKENVVGKCYVSEETRTLFEQLRTAKIALPRTQSGIDKMVSDGCRIAGLPKRINQHLLRKIWLSTAINLGTPEIVYKILSFKIVPQELLTYYLDRNELREHWKRIIEALPLEPKANGRVNNLEESIDLVLKALRKMIEREIDVRGKMEISDKEMIEIFLRERNDSNR